MRERVRPWATVNPVHTVTLANHLAGVLAVGRGIFVWLLFRSLVHAVGWPATIAILAVVAVVVTLVRQRR